MDHLNLFCTEDAVMFWGLYSNSFFSFQDVVCSGITLWLYETLNIFLTKSKIKSHWYYFYKCRFNQSLMSLLFQKTKNPKHYTKTGKPCQTTIYQMWMSLWPVASQTWDEHNLRPVCHFTYSKSCSRSNIPISVFMKNRQ